MLFKKKKLFYCPCLPGADELKSFIPALLWLVAWLFKKGNSVYFSSVSFFFFKISFI